MPNFFLDLISKFLSKKTPTIPTTPELPKEAPIPHTTSSSNDKTVVEVLHKLSYPSKTNLAGAIKQFQLDQGLKPDGVVGQKTLARIRNYEEKLKLAPPQMKQMRKFRATHYYVAEEKDYSGKKIPVYDNDKKEICVVPASFFCNSALEGTGKLLDGRLINVAGKTYVDVDPIEYIAAAEVYRKHIAYMTSKDRTPRPSRYFGVDYIDGQVKKAQPFQIVKNLGKGFGIGKKSIPHEINRTVATDQGLYSTSEPRFKGKGGLWPAGIRGWLIDVAGENKEHDGWVTAADVGGGIFGAHFDFFTGTKDYADDYPVRSNAVTYVWFEGIEDRIPPDYEYGLYDRK